MAKTTKTTEKATKKVEKSAVKAVNIDVIDSDIITYNTDRLHDEFKNQIRATWAVNPKACITVKGKGVREEFVKFIKDEYPEAKISSEHKDYYCLEE